MTVLRRVRRLALWLVVGLGLASLLVALVIPRLAGATPYTVLTGSMSPALPPGTLVVVKPAPPSEIGIGTVITYQISSGSPEVVTHRVVEVRSDLTGDVEWQTRGDANGVADAAWVRPEQVRGVVWYDVPWLGHLAAALDHSQRALVVNLVAGLLLAYAGLSFRRGLRSKDDGAETSETGESRADERVLEDAS